MKNLFHAHEPEPDPETEMGCGFMQGMLDGLADGTAKGVGKWYAEQHVAACPRCAAALARRQREHATGDPASKDADVLQHSSTE